MADFDSSADFLTDQVVIGVMKVPTSIHLRYVHLRQHHTAKQGKHHGIEQEELPPISYVMQSWSTSKRDT
jgi:hypothetical protein